MSANHSPDAGNMVDPDTLDALALRAEAGERPLNAWRLIAEALGWEDRTSVMHGLWWDADKVCRFEEPELAHSLDAVSALQEAVLPGWRIAELVEWPGKAWKVSMKKHGASMYALATAPTEPLARLAAILRALAAEARQ